MSKTSQRTSTRYNQGYKDGLYQRKASTTIDNQYKMGFRHGELERRDRAFRSWMIPSYG